MIQVLELGSHRALMAPSLLGSLPPAETPTGARILALDPQAVKPAPSPGPDTILETGGALDRGLRFLRFRPDLVVADLEWKGTAALLASTLDQLEGGCTLLARGPLPILDDRFTPKEAPAGFRAFRFQPRPGPTKPTVAAILWMQPLGLGDIILQSTALPLLAARYPGARIHALLREQARSILDACPHLHQIITFNLDMIYADPSYLEDVMAHIRELGVDLVIYPHAHRRLTWDLLALASGALVRIANGGGDFEQPEEWRGLAGEIYTRVVPGLETYAPQAGRIQDFLRGLGLPAAPAAGKVWFAPEDLAAADFFFKEHDLDPARTLAFFGGASTRDRLYGGYGEALALALALDPAIHTVVAMGEAAERGFHDRQLATWRGRSMNLCGQLELRPMLAILARCRLLLGTDSGPGHAACALGVPNVLVLPGAHFGNFFPYSPLTSAVVNPLDCFACNWRCPFDRFHCLHGIAPALVAHALRRALEDPGTRTRLFYQARPPAPAAAPYPLDPERMVRPGALELVPVDL